MLLLLIGIHVIILGVATIVNKLNNLPFNEHDEQLFEVRITL